jgi:hypothetical protein
MDITVDFNNFLTLSLVKTVSMAEMGPAGTRYWFHLWSMVMLEHVSDSAKSVVVGTR